MKIAAFTLLLFAAMVVSVAAAALRPRRGTLENDDDDNNARTKRTHDHGNDNDSAMEDDDDDTATTLSSSYYHRRRTIRATQEEPLESVVPENAIPGQYIIVLNEDTANATETVQGILRQYYNSTTDATFDASDAVGDSPPPVDPDANGDTADDTDNADDVSDESDGESSDGGTATVVWHYKDIFAGVTVQGVDDALRAHLQADAHVQSVEPVRLVRSFVRSLARTILQLHYYTTTIPKHSEQLLRTIYTAAPITVAA